MSLIEGLSTECEGRPVSEVLSAVLNESGYEMMLRTCLLYTSFHDDAGRTFFRADHVRFELESPIDVAEIQNLVFTGDNSRIYEGEDRTGTLIQFDFGPWHFQNETYWNEVNYYWRKD